MNRRDCDGFATSSSWSEKFERCPACTTNDSILHWKVDIHEKMDVSKFKKCIKPLDNPNVPLDENIEIDEIAP